MTMTMMTMMITMMVVMMTMIIMIMPMMMMTVAVIYWLVDCLPFTGHCVVKTLDAAVSELFYLLLKHELGLGTTASSVRVSGCPGVWVSGWPSVSLHSD
jgi:hypothetical protein